MRRFASNVRTFLLALVLGVSVWVSAVTGADPDDVRINTIPLEVIGSDPSLIITSDIPKEVAITLRAPNSVWEQLTAQDNPIQATLDLTDLDAGEHSVKIDIRVLERPYQIVLAEPKTVTVILEPLATRTLSIDPSISGLPAIGYQAGDAEIEPTEVTISGPKSLVEQATRARILINLDGIRETFDESRIIQIVDENNSILHGFSVTPEETRVIVPVSQQGGFRDVAVKVVVVGQIAAGYRLENISVFPPVVTVFASDPELVNSLPGILETQPLDLQDGNENLTTRLALNLPENVTLERDTCRRADCRSDCWHLPHSDQRHIVESTH